MSEFPIIKKTPEMEEYEEETGKLALWKGKVSKDFEKWKEWGYVATTLQGIMLDLLGKRDKAIACYQKALKTIGNRSNDMFFDIDINKEWLEKRLKTPFKWD